MENCGKRGGREKKSNAKREMFRINRKGKKPEKERGLGRKGEQKEEEIQINKIRKKGCWGDERKRKGGRK